MEVEKRALHVLSRLTYGPRPGEVARLAAGGEDAIQAWIRTQLRPETIPDEVAEGKLEWLETVKLGTDALIKGYHFLRSPVNVEGVFTPGEDTNDPAVLARHYAVNVEKLRDELTAKQLILAVDSRRQLNQVVFEFWWNHFNVAWQRAPWTTTSYERDAIRPHLFGKFGDLLRASAHHPAMLAYLDNTLSRGASGDSSGINENYARELMELHTIGAHAGYTQEDVMELGRILSGWGENPVGRTFEFDARKHDRGPKTWLAQSFQKDGGQEEGEKALDLLARHPATARFVCTKLARFFVSDAPPEALVARLEGRFRETGGDLREIYLALFTSPEFWQASFSKTKRPFQFVVSAIRGLGGEINRKVGTEISIRRAFADMGEQPLQCFPPTGYPDDPKVWVNPGSMVARLNFAVRLAAGRVECVSLPEIKEAGKGVARQGARMLASAEFQKR